MTVTNTSLVWRGTWEDGKRLTIRLSAVEMMKFSPGSTNDADTPRTGDWYMRLSSSKEYLNLDQETGDSIHEAWMHHLEHAVATRR